MNESWRLNIINNEVFVYWVHTQVHQIEETHTRTLPRATFNIFDAQTQKPAHFNFDEMQ